MEENDCRGIEGTRLSLTTPYDTPSEMTFMKYINIFLESITFVSIMTPFVDRCVDPTWFQNWFPDVTPSTATMSNFVWATFLTPTLLFTRIETGIIGFSFIGYRPNLVARKFGFSEMLSKSLYTREDNICWSERKFSIQEYKECMAFVRQQVL